MKIVFVIGMLLFGLNLMGMGIAMFQKDTIQNDSIRINTELFYDSLEVRAQRYRITRWLHDYMISSGSDTINKNLASYEYYERYKNKTIGEINIKSLEVFGPDFNDTTKTAKLWIERTANKMHTKSNLNVIRKNLWIKEGKALDPDLLMDNERFLRALPYLKDVRFIIKPRPENKNVVDILILTKDVFSFGLTGSVSNIHNGEIGISDRNILGIGHEVGLTLFGHTEKEPHLGLEAYYAINNVKGEFINFAAGYANNHIRNAFFFSFDRGFIRPQSVFAGGITASRSFRTNTINLTSEVNSVYALDYLYLDGWYGRRLKLGIKPEDNRFLMTLAGRIRYTTFYDRPPEDLDNRQYFANSTLYLGSISFSRRSYIRDYRVYSYGIIEDIPKGYLHELVLGYDHNEFGDRMYSHLFFSSGNLFKQKPYYFYTSLGLGSFWRHSAPEQGLLDVKINFISPLFKVWNAQTRQFLRLNYSMGINRFEVEELLLRNNVGIRGFGSRITSGQQRVTLNVENVFFQKKAILDFKTALFYFIDVGIVGQSDRSIFKEDYFAGIGMGLRIRNENLVFKTIQIRLSFYPNHPSDVSAVGFILDEVSRNRFYSFQPRGPEPLRYE